MPCGQKEVRELPKPGEPVCPDIKKPPVRQPEKELVPA